MNSVIQYIYKILTGLWYRQQRELDERDERIADLELTLDNKELEIIELRCQLDKYQSVFSAYRSFNKHYHRLHVDNEHHRAGVSAPPSTLCKLIKWDKSDW